RGLARPHWRRLNELINTYALPLYLFHSTGMTLWLMSVYGLYKHRLGDDRSPDLIWWAERPLAIAGPLLFTVPLIALFGRCPVHPELVEGEPVDALLQAAKGASMLVLGSHGHGRLMTVLLGSVSARCVRRADGPVVIIPARTAGEDEGTQVFGAPTR